MEQTVKNQEPVAADRRARPRTKNQAPNNAQRGVFSALGSWLWIVVHLAALFPLAWLLWDYWNDNLTANPIQDITFRTGKPALVLLVLSLACTPVALVTGWKRLLTFRRPLGLYAFMYVCLHLLTFTVLDYGLDWHLILQTALEKRYVFVGFAAFLLLLPLALTSTRTAMRALGKRWKVLHRLVYVAIPLAVIHFLWLVKADIREPLIYGAVVAVLLVLRIPAIKTAITNLRYRKRAAVSKASQ